MHVAYRKNGDGLNQGPLRDLDLTPEVFDFVQAIRLLRAKARLAHGASPPPEGESPDQRLFRAIAHPSLAYPAAQLHRATDEVKAETPGVPVLALNFFGLHGPAGILPAHVTQDVADAGRDSTLTHLLDFFNDHLARLFAKVSEATRLAAWFEEPQAEGALDRLTDLLLRIAGIPPASLRQGNSRQSTRLASLSVQSGAYFAQLWRDRPMSICDLQAMVRSMLPHRVNILPLESRWVTVEEPSRMRLRAGWKGSVLGGRCRNEQWGVRLRIGPLDYSAFRGFLPGRRRLRRLGELLDTALGALTDYTIQPILRGNEKPVWILGRRSFVAGTSGQVPDFRQSNPDVLDGRIVRSGRLGQGLFLHRARPRAGSDRDGAWPPVGDDPTHPEHFNGLRISAAAIRRGLVKRRLVSDRSQA